MIKDQGASDRTPSARRCPICGGDGALIKNRAFDESRVQATTFASRKSPELMHWAMALCASCDLLFALDPPSFSDLESAYSAADFDAVRESAAAARTYRSLLEREIVQRLGFSVPELQVLDVGCGDGAFLGEMRSLGAGRIVGLEISEEPIRRAPESVRPLIETCMVEDYRGSGFTVATTFQVLEHFSDPLSVVEGLRDALLPGGLVFGVTHDRRSVVNRLLGSRSPIWDIEHLQLFSPRSLAALFEAAGMHLVRVVHVTNSYPVDYWIRLSPLPGALRSRLMRAARPRGQDLPLPLRVGNMAFIARRPL